jgi:hypothetical protein
VVAKEMERFLLSGLPKKSRTGPKKAGHANMYHDFRMVDVPINHPAFKNSEKCRTLFLGKK